MIAATVTVAATAASLRSLIDTATSGQLTPNFNNGVCEVQIQAGEVAANFHVVYKPGAVVTATDSGFNCLGNTGDATGASSRIVFRAPTGNQLSLADIYLSGSGTARVIAFTL